MCAVGVAGRSSTRIRLCARRQSLVCIELKAGVAKVSCQGVDPLRLGIPREHEPATLPNEGVKMPASVPELVQNLPRSGQEHGVRLDRKQQADPGQVRHPTSETGCAGIGMVSVAQPGAAFQQADLRCGQEAHLGGELPRLLATISEMLGQGPGEEDHSFSNRHAVLSAAEAQDVDGRLPGDLGGGGA